jgi:hypothetical protein
MRRKVWLLTAVSALLLAVPGGLLADAVPQDVVRAASHGLAGFLAAIPSGQLDRFGFKSEAELAKAVLGTPIPLYTIEPATILAHRGDGEIHQWITPTGDWFVPVVSGGAVRGLLTVTDLAGAWQAVDLGAAGQAAEFDRLCRIRRFPEAWPVAPEGDRSAARAQAAGSLATDLKWLRIYQANCDFILAGGDDAPQLIPFQATALVLGWIQPEEPYDYPDVLAADAMSRLIPIVRDNLAADALPR